MNRWRPYCRTARLRSSAARAAIFACASGPSTSHQASWASESRTASSTSSAARSGAIRSPRAPGELDHRALHVQPSSVRRSARSPRGTRPRRTPRARPAPTTITFSNGSRGLPGTHSTRRVPASRTSRCASRLSLPREPPVEEAGEAAHRALVAPDRAGDHLGAGARRGACRSGATKRSSTSRLSPRSFASPRPLRRCARRPG